MALTAIPAAGAKLRGAILSGLITELRPTQVRLAADEPLTASSTTLENVAGLLLPCEADATYDGLLDMSWTLAAGATEDIKIGFSFPAGATLDFGGVLPHTAMGAGVAFGDGEFARRLGATSGVTYIAGGAGTTAVGCLFSVDLVMGSIAGSLQVMACQNVSGGNVVTVQDRSRLTLRRTS